MGGQTATVHIPTNGVVKIKENVFCCCTTATDGYSRKKRVSWCIVQKIGNDERRIMKLCLLNLVLLRTNPSFALSATRGPLFMSAVAPPKRPKRQIVASHFHCYSCLLNSLDPKHPYKTYVGLSVRVYEQTRELLITVAPPRAALLFYYCLRWRLRSTHLYLENETFKLSCCDVPIRHKSGFNAIFSRLRSGISIELVPADEKVPFASESTKRHYNWKCIFREKDLLCITVVLL
jgi:hypothetical protein